jgi:putative tributyrin esterase
MAFLKCDFFSQTLGISTHMNVIIPTNYTKKLKTLYLLHGYSNSYNIWQEQTSIVRYAEKYNLAVIMPDFQKSFYTNFEKVEFGYKYWDFLSTELLEISQNLFNLSDERSDNFVAGISMGGFGAFKLALNHPEKFAFAASLSGALDIFTLVEFFKNRTNESKMILGDSFNLKETQNDLFHVSTNLNTSNLDKPKLYQYCGTKDFLYSQNIAFKNHLERLNYDLTFCEDSGNHSWDFWDEKLKDLLEWLPLEKTTSTNLEL